MKQIGDKFELSYKNDQDRRYRIVRALDPGCPTFLTGYDGESIWEIGNQDIGKINRLCFKLDDLNFRIRKTKNQRSFRKTKTRGDRYRN